MPQSLANVLVHLIFSTKNREPLITADVERELHRYMASICRAQQCPSHEIGGASDHVHLACSLARTMTLANLVEEIKTGTSKWIKTKSNAYARFSWQAGYGAFSIGQSQLGAVKRYIGNQREHHRLRTFQDEFREFLRKYQVEYDELYVWD
jgi:REP element-mobilizing transposase RayT